MKIGMRRRAAIIVEFSMVLPVVVLSFAGMIEISRAMLLQHTADTAAYEGARQGMIPGATAAEAIAAAETLLQIAGLQGTTVTITPEVITESTPLITVDVEIPLASNCWVIPLLIKDYGVSSSVTLFCERPAMVQLTGVPEMRAKIQKVKRDDDNDDDN